MENIQHSHAIAVVVIISAIIIGVFSKADRSPTEAARPAWAYESSAR